MSRRSIANWIALDETGSARERSSRGLVVRRPECIGLAAVIGSPKESYSTCP